MDTAFKSFNFLFEPTVIEAGLEKWWSECLEGHLVMVLIGPYRRKYEGHHGDDDFAKHTSFGVLSYLGRLVSKPKSFCWHNCGKRENVSLERISLSVPC